VQPLARLFRLRGRLGRCALFGGPRSRDRLAPCLLHKDEVRRVRRPKVGRNRRQPAWGCVARRWDAVALERRPGPRHPRAPGGWLPCLGGLLQHNSVADRRKRDQAKAARQGCILGHRQRLRCQRLRQTRRRRMVGSPHRGFPVTVPLLRRPLRGANNPSARRHLHKQTPQAHATGTHLATHDMERHDQPRQAGEPRNTLAKRHDRGPRVAALLLRSPCLTRAAGHSKHCGRLTPGDPLGLASAIRRQQVSAFEALPALVAITSATLCGKDSSAHSSRRPKLRPGEKWMAQEGEGATELQALAVLSRPLSEASSRLGGRHRDRGLIYDTLFALDANLQPQPQMVETWNVSPYGLTYTFTLRPGLKWHDGAPVRATSRRVSCPLCNTSSCPASPWVWSTWH
jgi:hypothetical protein